MRFYEHQCRREAAASLSEQGNGPGVTSSPRIVGGMRHDAADDLACRPLVDRLGEQLLISR